MKIPSGSTDRYIYFVAVDATDLKSRETGLSSFTVVYSLNGAADVTYTTPTVSEIDASTMPGVYALLLDEGTTLTAGHDTEEYCVHITQASMAPVTRTIEIYRPKGTEGRAVTIETDGMAHADLKEWLGVAPLALSSQRVQSLLAATPPTAAQIKTAIEAAGSHLALIKAVTDDITDLATLADAVWDELITAAEHGTVSSAAYYVRQLWQSLVVRVDQCGDAGTSTTIDLNANASAVDDFYIGQLIVITAGTGKGQARACTDYDGESKEATIAPAWATAPDGDSWYGILNVGSSVVLDIVNTDFSTVVDTVAKLDDTLEDDAGTYRFTENALEEAPSGTGGDATAANQSKIIQILTGKWEITGNQLIIYDSDGTTPLYTFDLTRDGSPTEFNPDKREPV